MRQCLHEKKNICDGALYFDGRNDDRVRSRATNAGCGTPSSNVAKDYAISSNESAAREDAGRKVGHSACRENSGNHKFRYAQDAER